MTAYWSLVRARFGMLLQYRAAAAAGLGTQLFWGLIRVMIFEGFYRSVTEPQPMSYRDVVGYVWLGQATLVLMMGGVDPEIRGLIRTGTVAYELVRPLDLYWLWFTRSVASRTAPTLLRMVPLMAIAGPFLGLPAPPSPGAAAGWVAATLCAVLLSCALWTLVNVTMLWTISGEGVSRAVPALVFIFSGMLVPIPLFPEWTQAVVRALPFHGLADLPFRVYLGHLPLAELPLVLAQQLAWTGALILVGRWFLSISLRRLVVQGG